MQLTSEFECIFEISLHENITLFVDFILPSVLAIPIEFVKVVTFVIFEAVLIKGSALEIIKSCRFLNLRNQKFTIVNSTSAANTNAVHRPIHTSIA